MQTWPRWAIVTVGVVLLLIGAAGTCTKYIWSPSVDPAPRPTPTPTPDPYPRPDPSDVWKSLDPPTSNVIKGVLELPAPMEVNATRRFIPIVAKCDNEVRWLVSSHATAQVDVLESRQTNSIMVFPKPGLEDTIVILAYSAKDGKPTAAALTFISVKGDRPPPGPTPPTPDPPQPGAITKLHVTFLLDYTKQTRAISDIVNSKELRQWLKEHNHEVHELSARDNLKALGLDEHVKGKAPPLLILQTVGETGVPEGQVLLVAPLTSIQAVKDAIIKVTGKKE